MELVILNIGLDLGAISQQLFAMMVLMALVATIWLLERICPLRLIRQGAAAKPGQGLAA